MDYIRMKYGTILLKKIQENDIELDEQWDPANTIAVLVTCIEY